ncbi:MAG: hypothetical protein WBG62_20005, partial [Cyclobacteriaceae bacterium]
FTEFLNEYIILETEWLLEVIYDESEVDDLIKDINTKIEDIRRLGLTIKPDTSDLSTIDWFEAAMNNEFRRQMEKKD